MGKSLGLSSKMSAAGQGAEDLLQSMPAFSLAQGKMAEATMVLASQVAKPLETEEELL